MANWKKHFTITGCSKFVLPGIGEIDTSKEFIPEEKLLKAYQRKCPYVGLTPEGIRVYDPEKKSIEVKNIEKKEPFKKPKSKGTVNNSEKPE